VPLDDDKVAASVKGLWREDVCENGMTIDNLIYVGCDGEVCICWARGALISGRRTQDW
jgi:hypothetical protein